ncbi:MAG: zinc ribbon domain-containing protein [Haloarculaceae archaeon]
MGRTTQKRPWLAALLALIAPGFGHLYLREWIRALLWFGLILSVTSLLMPASVMDTKLSIDAIVRASRQVPLRTQLALLAMTALSMVDAYWIATRSDRRAGTGDGQGTAGDGVTTCPNCGKELDEDLDFCHWCTARLDRPEEDEGGQISRS